MAMAVVMVVVMFSCSHVLMCMFILCSTTLAVSGARLYLWSHTRHLRRAISIAGEMIELARRTICTGVVVLIPYEYMFIRIGVASAVSLVILVVTAVLKPFKNEEDTGLALVSQTILVFSFGCCALIRLLNSEDITEADKQALMGFTDSEGFFMTLGVLCIGFLVVLLSVYCCARLPGARTHRLPQGGVQGCPLCWTWYLRPARQPVRPPDPVQIKSMNCSKYGSASCRCKTPRRALCGCLLALSFAA
eukprot:3263311-Prymnesium_polylepis.2